MRISPLPRLAAATAVALLAACDGSGGGPTSRDETPVRIRVEQRAPVVLLPAGTLSLSATAFAADGGGTAAPAVTWSAADPLVATVSPTGQVTARAWGETRVVATAGAMADTVTLRVRAPAPTAVWRFTVEFGFREGQTPLTQAQLEALARAQLDTVNARFNAPGTFDGRFEFALGRVYRFAHPASAEIDVPARADYRVLVDSAERTLQTAWYGWQRTTVMAYNQYAGGVPIESGRSGVTIAHELGHARGAVDVYAQEVQTAANNPVTGETWLGERSLMVSLEPGWDPHSRHVVNRAGGSPPPVVYEDPLPATVTVVVRDAAGAPVANADLAVHGVGAYSWRVNPGTAFRGTTDAAGRLVVPNPVRNSGFMNALLVATSGARRGSAWVPFTETALTAIRSGGAAEHVVHVTVR